MQSVTLTLSALVAIANAGTFTWNGVGTGFDSAAMWEGGNPNLVTPLYTVIGELGKKTVSLIPPNTAGGQYSLGSKLVLSGSAKLFLGDGLPGSKTVLSFASSTANDAQVATFNPAGLDKSADGAGGFDYNCNLNWLSDSVVPKDPPCRNDDVVFKPENAYYVSTFNQDAGASSFKVLGSSESVSECQATSSGPTFLLGSSPIAIDIQSCQFKFGFGKKPSQGASSWKCPTSSCVADAVAVDGNGNTIQIYTKGSNKGKGFQVNPDGSLTPIVITNTTNSNGDPVYKFGDIEVLPNGDIFTTTTTTTTTQVTTLDSKVSGSSGTDDAASGAMTTIVIIVVIVAVIIIAIIVVAVVIMRKKAGSKASDDRNIVSFENPMYDDVDGAQLAANTNNTNKGGGQDDGLYDDPEMSNNSGYMDVPANGDQPQTGGYMDVAPHEEDDDDDDYEDDDDNEDI